MIGNRIKELRLESGMTQEELGKVLNVKKAAISKYENNNLQPSIEILKQVANFYNVTIDYLIGSSRTTIEEPQGTYQVPIKDLDEDFVNLINKIETDEELTYKGKMLSDEDRIVFKKAAQLMKDMIKLKYNE